MSTLQFKCLFTRQKLQKRKRYEDGVLVVQLQTRRANLFGCDPAAEEIPVGTCRDSLLIDASTMGTDPATSLLGCELDFEKFTVEVEHLQHTAGGDGDDGSGGASKHNAPESTCTQRAGKLSQHNRTNTSSNITSSTSRKGSFCITERQTVPVWENGANKRSDTRIDDDQKQWDQQNQQHLQQNQQQQQQHRHQHQQQQPQRSVGGSFGRSFEGAARSSRLKLRGNIGGNSAVTGLLQPQLPVPNHVVGGGVVNLANANDPCIATGQQNNVLQKQADQNQMRGPRRTTDQLIRLFESKGQPFQT